MNQPERRAVEALRTGVPNRDAVRHLGTDQRPIEGRFLDALSQVAGERLQNRQLPGLLVAGDFGAGKSHLLEWLQHVALEQNFACSKVVISKESPLGHPHRLFRTAIHALRLPHLVGGLEEVALRLTPGSTAYEQAWQRVADPQLGFDPLFQATLAVFRRTDDVEVHSKIVGFWRGDRIDMAELRRWMRAMRIPGQVRRRKIADLALPRFRFAAELMAASGFAGWVLLLDELELIASFSLLSRAAAYRTLGELLGLVPDQQLPGVFVVGAVTSDLAQVVFEERRDEERIPQRLQERQPELVRAATAGMDALRPGSSRFLHLEPISEEGLARVAATVRQLYGQAYQWAPPAGEVRIRERSLRMRQYVRDWITRWDLLRLDPGYEPVIETESYAPDLGERPDLERTSELDSGDVDAG